MTSRQVQTVCAQFVRVVRGDNCVAGHLALMRPLSLAGLFAALSGGVLGVINVLRFGGTRELTAETYRVIIGTAESLVATFVGFACLTVAWLLVAAGMGRQGARLRE